MPPPVAAQIGAQLAARGQTVAVAETAAGGLLSASLLAVAGASGWYLGGVVAYSAASKSAWLGVSPEAFQPYGVVSETGAEQLAAAVRAAAGATWGVGEAGIAGPQTGRRSAKPAGLAYVAVAGPVTLVREVRSGRDERVANQMAFALAALNLLWEALQSAG
jgi:PncC family amidohydrolase